MSESNKDLITVTIDARELVQASEDGKKLVFDPEAQAAIVKLLEIQKHVSEAVDAVKSEIEQQALAYSPDFASISGDKVKASYSAAGAVYGFNKENRKRMDRRFFTRKVTYSPNSKELVRYENDNHGRLPAHIFRNDRTKKLNLKIKEDA